MSLHEISNSEDNNNSPKTERKQKEAAKVPYMFAPEASWVCSPSERQWNSVTVGTTRNDPIELFYQLVGPSSAQEKLVFIMGHSGTGDFWHYQVEHLKKIGDYQMVIFDNRGIGKTTSSKGLYTSSQMAQDTAELVDHLGWERYHVIGMSLGGMIAQELALARPEQIASLCLIVTHNGDPFASIPTLSAVNLIGRLTFAGSNESRAELAIRALYGPIILDNASLRQQFYDFHKKMLDKILSSFNVFGYIGQSSAVARHRVPKERFEAIKKKFPITIIGSTDDIMVRSECATVLGSVLDEQVKWLPSGYGHNVNFACPHILNSYLSNHLSSACSISPPSSPSSTSSSNSSSA